MIEKVGTCVMTTEASAAGFTAPPEPVNDTFEASNVFVSLFVVAVALVNATEKDTAQVPPAASVRLLPETVVLPPVPPKVTVGELLPQPAENVGTWPASVSAAIVCVVCGRTSVKVPPVNAPPTLTKFSVIRSATPTLADDGDTVLVVVKPPPAEVITRFAVAAPDALAASVLAKFAAGTVFVTVPAACPAGTLTVAVIVQVLFAAIVPPENVSVPVPAPPSVGAPQFAFAVGVPLIVRPVGSVSLIAAFVSGLTVMTFCTLSDKVVVPPATTALGENDFVGVGCPVTKTVVV